MTLRYVPMSLLGTVALLMAALAPGAMTTRAQDGGAAGYTLTVGASQCDGVEEGATCEPLAGLSVTTEPDEGDAPETCVTEVPADGAGTDALCEVVVRFGGTGVVTADEATVPDGYKVVVPSLSYDAPAQGDEALKFPDVRFTVVPEDAQVPGLDVESLAIGAVICDGPVGGPDAAAVTCEAFGDAEVTVTDEAGEVVGSCTLERFDTPNGGSLASCGVPVQFEATYAVTLDESAVPDGYVVDENPISFTATDREQGGGDGPDISFAVVPETGDEPAPAAPSAEGDTDEPAAGAAGTGNPAAIYAGDCDTEFAAAEAVAVLSETTAPEGEARGAAPVGLAETSFTTLDLPLDDLLDEDHVLVVTSSEDPDALLVCGAIGGPVTDDGTLVIGLAGVGESSWQGVAYLSGDDAQTDVTVFVVSQVDATR